LRKQVFVFFLQRRLICRLYSLSLFVLRNNCCNNFRINVGSNVNEQINALFTFLSTSKWVILIL
jgi:hypothetical protein